MENNSQLATTLLFFIKKQACTENADKKFSSDFFMNDQTYEKPNEKNPVYTDNIFY